MKKYGIDLQKVEIAYSSSFTA